MSAADIPATPFSKKRSTSEFDDLSITPVVVASQSQHSASKQFREQLIDETPYSTPVPQRTPPVTAPPRTRRTAALQQPIARVTGHSVLTTPAQTPVGSGTTPRANFQHTPAGKRTSTLTPSQRVMRFVQRMYSEASEQSEKSEVDKPEQSLETKKEPGSAPVERDVTVVTKNEQPTELEEIKPEEAEEIKPSEAEEIKPSEHEGVEADQRDPVDNVTIKEEPMQDSVALQQTEEKVDEPTDEGEQCTDGGAPEQEFSEESNADFEQKEQTDPETVPVESVDQQESSESANEQSEPVFEAENVVGNGTEVLAPEAATETQRIFVAPFAFLTGVANSRPLIYAVTEMSPQTAIFEPLSIRGMREESIQYDENGVQVSRTFIAPKFKPRVGNARALFATTNSDSGDIEVRENGDGNQPIGPILSDYNVTLLNTPIKSITEHENGIWTCN